MLSVQASVWPCKMNFLTLSQNRETFLRMTLNIASLALEGQEQAWSRKQFANQMILALNSKTHIQIWYTVLWWYWISLRILVLVIGSGIAKTNSNFARDLCLAPAKASDGLVAWNNGSAFLLAASVFLLVMNFSFFLHLWIWATSAIVWAV